MKAVKVLGIFIISLFLMNVEVNAAKGTYGVCYGEEILDSTGYCRLASPVSGIYASAYTSSEHKLYYDNGLSPAYSKYFGTIDGKSEILFCIDPNLSTPNSSYPYARSINLKNNYDKAIAKVYQMYINDSVYLMNQNGVSFTSASSNYLQAANVAMRAITKKYGFDISSNKTNVYTNVVDQLEGRTANSPKLIEGTDAYNLIKRYYCSGISLTSNPVSHCSNYSGISTANLVDYKFTLNHMPEATEDIDAGADKFEKIISIKIDGIQKLASDYDAYKNTDPSFYITNISCANDKLTCTPVVDDITTKNLIHDNPNEDYILKVRVSGNKADFKNDASTNISIKYKYHHILNTENLAVLRTHLTEQKTQRLIALMPDREQEASKDIKINLPSMCEVREEDGVVSYYFGGTQKNELEYLQAGCCNIKPEKLENNTAIEFYMDTCATEDLVILDTKCDNDKDLTNPSRSILQQQDINKTLRLVSNAEKMYYQDKSYTESDFKEQIAKTDNYRDDVYMEELIAKGNDYCSLYTSESQVIEFPGTAEATSGRFFIFDEGQQPKVEGRIMLNFHTNYDRWKNDYEKAIEEEEEAYTRWQEALNFDDAIQVASTNSQSRTCSYCCEGYTSHYDEEGNYTGRSCNGHCYPTYTYYSGTTAGTYYRADGSVISKASASWETSTACSGTPKPNAQVSYYKGLYNTAVRNREKLESYKTDCQKKSDLANNWNYYLAPDLYFNYKQEYYKNNKMIHTSLDQPLQLEISYRSEKYWPNASTAVKEIPGTKTSKFGDESFTINYGRGNDAVNKTGTFDKTADYKIGYEQTLYYIPTVKYYSLLPDGHYETDVTKYKSENYLDAGYVFNVEITNYTNQYLTWFSIKNIGHLMQDTKLTPKLKSNLQIAMDNAINEIDDEAVLKIYNDEQLDSSFFNNICYYNNEQIIYQPECPPCDEYNPNFKPQYFTRTIAKENMFPNEGVDGRVTGANWASIKGRALEEEILRNSDLIYGDFDGSEGFLEGSFTLTPAMMNSINNEYNKGKNYSDFNLECKNAGKECISAFLTELVKNSDKDKEILENNRINGWRYFVDGKWERGSISSLLDGKYPEETASLTDWP